MKDIDWVEIGARIVFERTKRRVSQIRLSEAINLTPGGLSRYEKGNREIPLTICVRICKVLSIPITYLLGLETRPTLTNGPIAARINKKASDWPEDWQLELLRIMSLYELTRTNDIKFQNGSL